MEFTPDASAPPLFPIKPQVRRSEKVVPPRKALPLESPLTKREEGSLEPKPYRIMQSIRSVCVGAHQNAAIDCDDRLWLWGSLPREQDGITYADYAHDVNYIPQQHMSNVLEVALGMEHTACLTKDGKLWCWGDNALCQLGLGDYETRPEPTLVMEDVLHVYANEYQTYAIKQDNTLWGWGFNPDETIPGAPEDCQRPVFILDGVQSFTSNGRAAMAVKQDGTLWGWGWNNDTLFCAQEAYRKYAPTHLLNEVKHAAMQAADTSNHCLVTMKNGDLYSMGAESPGSMVTYITRRKYGPNPVKVMEGVARTVAGNYFSLILMEDGRLFGTGENSVGQCGTGRSTARFHTPKPIMDHVIDMAAGRMHGMALQKNGDLWIWGGDYGIHIADQGEAHGPI